MRIWILLSTLALTACGGQRCQTGPAGDGFRIALDGMCLEHVRAESLEDGAWVEAQLAVSEPGDGGVVVTMTAPGESSALRLQIPGLDVDRMHQQGYQSWDFSGTVEIPRALATADDGAPRMAAAQSGDPLDEELGVSYHAALWRAGVDGPTLVAGALSATRAVTGLAAVRREDGGADLDILYGPAREPLGDGAKSEPIYLAAAPEPEAAFDLLSTQVAAAHPDAAPARPPGGWYSWNEHFADIDADLIDAHIDEVAASLEPAGMPLVEIDDGWEQAWGDWRANDRFPGGMAAIGAAITGRGLIAGVWMAPFLVDVSSQAAQRAPELFVRDAAGDPIVHRLTGISRSFYVLDGSNPESMSLVTERVRALADAGFTYFKLDFLYAGALAGQRAEQVPGVKALRDGLELIREAAGDDAILNACGAPTLPVLGLADSLRIGPDTAYDGFNLTWPLVVDAARNLAARRYLFPSIWPDADQTQVRPPYTDDEAKASAAIAALAGPAYSLGDDLTTLPADRLDTALDPMLLDLAGADAPARPVGIMTEPTDEIAASPILESFRFLGGIATEPPPAFEAVGAGGTRYRIAIDWAQHRASIEPVSSSPKRRP